MAYVIVRSSAAVDTMNELEATDERKFRKVRKTLGLLSTDPRYPGLHSHKREVEKGPNGEDVWESYVENNTPSAWRVFWYYGPETGKITVFAITPHP